MADTDRHWQETDAAIQKKLRVMQSEGVRTITWHIDKGACDKCLPNSNQTVRVGTPFKSGAMMPPEHDHCGCFWSDDKGRTYQWTGKDGIYTPYEGKIPQ